jgi:hypothetical protein
MTRYERFEREAGFPRKLGGMPHLMDAHRPMAELGVET